MKQFIAVNSELRRFVYENCIFLKKTLWLLLPPSGVSAVLCEGFQYPMSYTKCIIYSQAWYNYLLMFAFYSSASQLDMWMQHGGFHSTWNNYFVINIHFFLCIKFGSGPVKYRRQSMRQHFYTKACIHIDTNGERPPVSGSPLNRRR